MKKIIILLVSLWICLWGLNKFYDFILPYNKNVKMGYVTTEPLNATVLIHGPCEPEWMIDPLQFDTLTNLRSYNLALNHSGFADNFIHLYQYLKYQKAPAYLLLYVTPESMDEKYNTFNTYRFTPYLKDSIIANVVKEMDPDYFRWSFIPFMKHAYYSNFVNFNVLQGSKHFLSNRHIPFHPTGFRPPVGQAWHYDMQQFISFYPKATRFKWTATREKYLRRTIQYAKSKGAKVILYESPVYAASISLQENRTEHIEKIKTIAQELEVDFWLFDDLPMAHDKSNFFSTLNTTQKGSQLFTDTLGKQLRWYIEQ